MKKTLILLLWISALLLAACDWDKTDPKPEEFLVGVDLGLPSGVLWGSQNIGTYRSDLQGDEYELYERRGDPLWGSENSKYLLAPDKDIAQKELGENWRLPTVWEYRELLDYCTWERSSKYRHAGYLVKSKVNSNSIFIPFNPDYKHFLFSEYFKDSSRYWTSTLNKNGTPFYLEVSDRGQLTDSQNVIKCLIRPVIGRKDKPESIAVHEKAIKLSPGDTTRLAVDFTPADSYDKYLEYTSSNPSVAYINDRGELFALTPGQATVQATSTCLGKTVECQIEVGAFIAPGKVDLGLPSGNLWSSFNLGAKDNLSNGLFFKWGNVQPEWKFADAIHLGNYSQDSNTVLLPGEDPACVYLGGKWRTPLVEDYKELIEYCNIEYEEGAKWAINILKSKVNGNSIVLLRGDGQYFFSNFEYLHHFFYWAAQDIKESPGCAQAFGFGLNKNFRYVCIIKDNALPLRPVWGERKD